MLKNVFLTALFSLIIFFLTLLLNFKIFFKQNLFTFLKKINYYNYVRESLNDDIDNELLTDIEVDTYNLEANLDVKNKFQDKALNKYQDQIYASYLSEIYLKKLETYYEIKVFYQYLKNLISNYFYLIILVLSIFFILKFPSKALLNALIVSGLFLMVPFYFKVIFLNFFYLNASFSYFLKNLFFEISNYLFLSGLGLLLFGLIIHFLTLIRLTKKT